MVESGFLSRIDVGNAAIATEEGISVGDTESQVFGSYGDSVVVEPNAYDPEASYLEVVPEDPSDNSRLVFDSDSTNTVNNIRVGDVPSVRYVEGCA